ncbi:MAG TPA: cysteine hydrolase family protein [Puia sp.]|nr:cysteine hydrolase family protein [Puia sp.]
MSISRQDGPALVLVDVQKGWEELEYWGGRRNNEDAEERAAELLDVWRGLSLPVFHIKHCSISRRSPLHASNRGNDFQDLVRPVGGEPVVKKRENSAFIGTCLKEELEALAIGTLVIAGLTTDHCVSTTVRMAGNYGFETFVVSDATATFNRRGLDGINYSAELMHITALASLESEFAKVVTVEWVKGSV